MNEEVWILLKADEDGNPVNLFWSKPNIAQIMEDYGIERFQTDNWLKDNPDPSYWKGNQAVLLKAEVRLPRAVEKVTDWEV